MSAPMHDQERQVHSRRGAVVPPLSKSEPAPRYARGTQPPEFDASSDALAQTVTCNSCRTSIPLSRANILSTHAVCNTCILTEARTAALAALPRNAEISRLPRQLGAPLWALIGTFVMAGALTAIFNYT